MNWAILGEFLGPNSPKYGLILLKLAREVVFKETQTIFQKFWKNSNFCKRETPKVFTFGPTLTPFFPLKMAEIEKN